MLYLAVHDGGRQRAGIFVRNSGTEEKTGINVRGAREDGDELVRIGEAALHFLAREMKDHDHPMARAEKAVLEALADGIFPADAEHLAPVLEQAQLLARLVEDLRTLSLADAGRLALAPVVVDLNEWAAGVVSGFQTVAAERGVALTLEVAGDLPGVKMDPERMGQVLGNLLGNALRHTPQGSRVVVRAARSNDGVVVSTADSGPGVPPQHLPHIFERFWRGDPSRSRRTGGSGLGLAIARRIVEAHGGRIWAENVPQGGVRVSFSLPAA